MLRSFLPSFALVLLVSSSFLIAAVVSHGGHDHHHHGHTHDHEEAGGDKAVVSLTEATFADAVSSTPLTLVEFFAPWCGHCKALAPNYEAAAQRLKDNSEVRLAAVDCTTDKDLCGVYGVKGFPTLKLFRSTSAAPVDYSGGRSTDDIVKFMSKQSAPLYTTLNTTADVAAFKSSVPGIKIVGVFTALTDAAATAFIDAVTPLRNDYTFAVTSAPDIIPGLSADVSLPLVALWQTGDEDAPTAVTSLSSVPSDLLQWISAEAFPLFGSIGPENYQKYVDRGLPIVWTFYDPAQQADALAPIEQAAAAVKGKLSLVKLDGVKWAEHAKHFGLPSTPLPQIVVEDRKNNRNFPFSEALSAESFATFLQSFLSGTLPVKLKSEPAPADNSGAVTVVTGNTFSEIVLNDAADVFVEFYAPWCGHCKNLAPKWEELGAEFASDDNVVIAKIDATANDTPQKIEGFPTLIFYPAGHKAQPITYSGDRTPTAMADFVRQKRRSGIAAAAAAAGSATHTEL